MIFNGETAETVVSALIDVYAAAHGAGDHVAPALLKENLFAAFFGVEIIGEGEKRVEF